MIATAPKSFRPTAKAARCVVASIMLVACLTGCMSDVRGYHYRLTLTVDVNGTIRTGSSVVAVREGLARGLGTTTTLSASRGEATLVDLGDGRYLLALMTGTMSGARGYFRPWMQSPTPVLAFAYGLKASGPVSAIDESLSNVRGPRAITASELPDMVTFKDIRDPDTLTVVDPKNISATLPGVSLVNATIEVTSDEVTRPKLLAVMPWIKAKPSDRNSEAIKALNHFGFARNSFSYGVY